MLQVRNITFAYKGATPIYEGLNLGFSPGERVALLAPSGFGKTTLCRIIAGYEKPQQGEVLVDGRPLPERGVCPVQLVMQHPEVAVDPRRRMRDTLLEASPDALANEELLEAFGIKNEWLARFPHELSGGELQRFCIARALMANPSYLIADEISTMLDALTQAQIWKALMQIADYRQMGIIFTSHSPALTSQIATRVIELDKL